jgi:hypothetical protein
VIHFIAPVKKNAIAAGLDATNPATTAEVTMAISMWLYTRNMAEFT